MGASSSSSYASIYAEASAILTLLVVVVGCGSMVSLAPPVVRFVFLIMHANRFLETLHTGFCIEFVYSYLIGNFGDVKYFIHINWYVPIFSQHDTVTLYSLDHCQGCRGKFFYSCWGSERHH